MKLFREVLELEKAYRALEERVARDSNLTSADLRLLSALGPGAPVSRVARQLGLTRQSVQRVADRLSERGLARFEPNPDHQRSPILRPTDTGTRARERADRELREWEASLDNVLEPEELETARIVLKTLRDAIDS